MNPKQASGKKRRLWQEIRYLFAEGRLLFTNTFIASVPSRRIRRLLYRRVMKFSILEDASIHLNCRFTAVGRLRIGARSVINERCSIDTRGGIEIGEDVSVSPGVTLLTAQHNLQDVLFDGIERSIMLGNRVFIGTGAIVLPGVVMGEGAALGAGSVATKEIPAFEIWAGVPARYIARRPIDLNYSLSYDRLFH